MVVKRGNQEERRTRITIRMPRVDWELGRDPSGNNEVRSDAM